MDQHGLEINMKELLLKLADKYEASYKKWCNENPGYIMHNDAIRELTCRKLAEECNTVEDIKSKRDESLANYEKYKGTPNGHWIAAQTCNEIIKTIEESEENL